MGQRMVQDVGQKIRCDFVRARKNWLWTFFDLQDNSISCGHGQMRKLRVQLKWEFGSQLKMFFDWPDVVAFSGTKCYGNYPFFPNNSPIWQISFLLSLSTINFLITLTSKFLNYPLQISKNIHTSQFLLQFLQ